MSIITGKITLQDHREWRPYFGHLISNSARSFMVEKNKKSVFRHTYSIEKLI